MRRLRTLAAAVIDYLVMVDMLRTNPPRSVAPLLVPKKTPQRVYSVPRVRLSTFNVDASQRVPHDFEFHRTVVDRQTDQAACTVGDSDGA